DGELLAKGEVFEHQTAARPKPAKHGSEPEPKQVKHGNQVIADRLCRLPCEVVDFTAGQDCDEGQSRKYYSSPHHFTAIFTSLPFTTSTFTTSLPAMAALTFSSASASSRTCASSASAGATMRLRILPFTWIAISTSSSLASAGSYCGHGARNSSEVSPSISHNSCERYGANGASISTRLRCASATSAGGASGSPRCTLSSYEYISFNNSMIEIGRAHV